MRLRDFTVSGGTWAQLALTTSRDAGRLTRTGANPSLTSAAGLAIKGSLDRYVWLRVRKVSGGAVGASWVGRLSYVTAGHGISASYKKEISAPSGPPALGAWFDLVFDMHALTAGGTDWADATITQLKVELDNDSSSGGSVWDIRYLRHGPEAFGALAGYDEADTEQIAPYAVTESVSAHTAGSVAPSIGSELLLQTVTITTAADEIPDINFGCDVSFTGTASSFLVLRRKTNGGAATVTTGGSTSIAAASGHAQRLELHVLDDLAPAGTHVYEMVVASSGVAAAKSFSNRLLSAKKAKR